MDELSPREIEVLALASRGLSNRDIGAQLYVGSETVKSHMKAIFRKLGVDSRHQLRMIVELSPELKECVQNAAA